MENINNENIRIESGNQKGGITAQNITINNNYGKESKTKVNLNFGGKAGKLSVLGIVTAGLIYGATIIFSGTAPKTNEEFYDFLAKYFHSLTEKSTDANDYFADNISIFYTKKNVTPDMVNKFREESDHINGLYDIDKTSIRSRKAGNITYWRFISGLICFRPSRQEYEKCRVEMEYGIGNDGKITSIEQLGYWNLSFTKEKPKW